MKVTLWGTRGSLPSAGPETVRYGGNTSCVEVRADDGSLLILDAGSGIRRLGERIGPNDGRIDLLLTHLHLDHLQGIGFFLPLFAGEGEVHVWGPPSTSADLRTRLGRYLSPPLFPVRVRDLGSRIVLHDAPQTATAIGPFTVRADLIIHPGSTVGYRISGGHPHDRLPARPRAGPGPGHGAGQPAAGRRASTSPRMPTCCSTTPSTRSTSGGPGSAGATRASTRPSRSRS